MEIRYQQHPDLIAAQMDGETVMLSVTTGKYFALKGIGHFIWEVISQPTSIDEIVDAVSQRFDVDPAQAQNDCEKFVKDLTENNLVNKL